MDINIIYETQLCYTILLVKQKKITIKYFHRTVAAIVEQAPIGVPVLPWVPHRKNRQ